MTKQDLVDLVANSQPGITKTAALAAVNAIMDGITDALAKGDSVRLTGFGTFEVRTQKARERVLPGTNKKKMYPAKKVPKFRAGKALKEAVA